MRIIVDMTEQKPAMNSWEQPVSMLLNALSAFIEVMDERMAKGIEDAIGKEASPVSSDQNIPRWTIL